MHVIHLTTEMAPFAKVGGLGDVMLGLSRALVKNNVHVAVILPKYDCIDTTLIQNLQILPKELIITFDGQSISNTIWQGKYDTITLFFIESHHPKQYFNRGIIYGCEDDIDRFLYFSLCCAEFLNQSSHKPDIIHLHDWPTAAVAPILKDQSPDRKEKLIFSSHNMEYQGLCTFDNFSKICLKNFKVPNEMKDHVHSNQVNLLKGAIIYSDAITTVSPTYAKEVQTIQKGHGLHQLLKKYSSKFYGIINGIDYTYWNPENDIYLPSPSKKSRDIIENKKEWKHILRQKFSLMTSNKPIVAMICRLVPQKGISLIPHAIETLLKLNSQFVLLGTSPIPEIQKMFKDLEGQYRNSKDIAIILHHQEQMAHLIFAASDFFLIPSIFEPCGLTQMIALRYGSLPIVHKTGGLSDTIHDIDMSLLPTKERNGFVFEQISEIDLDRTLKRALNYWYEKPNTIKKLQQNGLSNDFSWTLPSQEYTQLYSKLVNNVT